MGGGFSRILDEAREAGGILSCSCGRTHALPVRSITVSRRAIEQIGAIVADSIGDRSRILVTADAWTLEAAGHEVEKWLRDTGHTVSTHVWSSNNGALAPDADAVVDLLMSAGPGQFDALIPVGGGTVHDLTKFAATKLGMPYVSVPTAASVDAYLSTSSALLSRGLKVSVSGMRPPIAVVADVDVLEEAPPTLIGSAVADQFSKVVCSADWVLANHLHGTSICPRSWELNRGVLAMISQNIATIAACTADGHRILMEALIDSGLGMLLYGSSLPASGSEHLIAHMLESIAAAESINHTPHGHRVGVAALIVSQLYERLIELEPETVEVYAKRIPGVAAGLRSGSANILTGGMHTSMDSLTPVDIAAEWPALRARLRETLDEHQDSIRVVMLNAGAPTTYAELGFDEDHVAQAIRTAPFLRDRYGILHLLRDMDLLDEWLPDAVSAVAPVQGTG